MNAFLYPSDLPCSEILSHISDNGIAIGDRRHFQDSVQFIGSRETGDKKKSVTIYNILHHQSAYGNDHILKKNGSSKFQKSSVQSGHSPEIFFRHFYDFYFSYCQETV